MVLMLPTATDNGARLAAILPTALGLLAPSRGATVAEGFATAAGLDAERIDPAISRSLAEFPHPRSLVLVVIDGLGLENLRARAAHARELSGMSTRRLSTVIPSTTGAALTSLLTGRLPGSHGLIGYRIRHPEAGLVTTLSEWDGIRQPREWQRATPLFERARELGLRSVAIGRPAHATGGLTEAILRGADYLPGPTIEDRCAIASRLLRDAEPALVYLYIDELDRAAHRDGWQSDAWLRRLEQVDAALGALRRTLPSDTAMVVTADHGIVDVPADQRVLLDPATDALSTVAEIGGEPRFRSLYLTSGSDPEAVSHEVQQLLRKRAWVGTRDAAIDGGWFGPVAPGVAERLGDVLVVARGQSAFLLPSDSAQAQAMVGHHGGLSDAERGVPLIWGGALDGTAFATLVGKVALALEDERP